jgi:hypothetical protein
VELDEFDVSQPSPSAECGRYSVTRGHRGIRRHGIDLANTAGGQDDRTGVHSADTASGAFPQYVQRHPSDGRLLPWADLGWNEIKDQRMLDDLDAAIGGDRGDQRAFDLGTSSVTPRMCDPIPHVAALASQLQPAGKIAIEFCASVDQLGYLVWALSDEHAYGFLDAQASAGHQRVVNVLLNCVALGLDPGDAALSPVSRSGRDLIFGDDHDRAEIPALQGSGEASDARADYDDVDLADPAGPFGRQTLGQHRQRW